MSRVPKFDLCTVDDGVRVLDVHFLEGGAVGAAVIDLAALTIQRRVLAQPRAEQVLYAAEDAVVLVRRGPREVAHQERRVVNVEPVVFRRAIHGRDLPPAASDAGALTKL